MTVFISDENKRNFWTYFNVADELYGGLDLDEIVLVAVEEAEAAAKHFHLSWPPYLPEAEEFALDHRKELD